MTLLDQMSIRPTRQDITQQVLTHIVKAIDNPVVTEKPFFHCEFDPIFPPDLYPAIIDALPPFDQYMHSNNVKHVRKDGTCVRGTLHLSKNAIAQLPEQHQALWGSIADALKSTDFKRAIFHTLEKPLCHRLGIDAGTLRKIGAYPHPHLVKNLGTYKQSPHAGTSKKLITIQFHLPGDQTQVECGPALYTRKLLNLRNIMSPTNRFHQAKKIAFKPNAGHAFVQTRTSFLGQEVLPADTAPVNSLMMFYLVDPTVANEDGQALPVIV